MKRWLTKPLGDILEVSRERIQPLEFPNTSFNYVGLENVEGHTGNLLPYRTTPGAEIKSTKNIFHPGQILFGKLRPYLNKVHLAREKGICSTDIFVLNPRQHQMAAAFASYFLRSPVVLAAVSNAMVGANLPRINEESLLEIPAPVPPLVEQERIVKLLDEAEELQKLRIQADRRTATLIPALFHDMFGDPAMNPQDFPISRLGELCGATPNYGTMVPARADEGEWLSVRVANIQDGLLDLTDQKFVNLPDEMLERHTVKDGDILLARAIGSKDHLGKCIVARPGNQKWAFDSHLMRVRLNRQRCEPLWLKTLLDTSGGRRLFLNNTRQSAVQFNINSKEFASIAVPLPPLPLQKEFAARVSDIRAMQAEQAVSRRQLDKLFQSMLHRAFQGKLQGKGQRDELEG